MSKKKPQPREFYVLASETGWDFKRWYYSFHPTRKHAELLMQYLNLKDPHDKREIIHVREVIEKGKRK